MRRSKPEKREILPDIRYHHIIIQTLIQHMLTRGKKSTATRVMYDSLDLIKERSGGKNPVEVFDAALKNVAPVMEVRPRRVGGATYQVPMEVPPARRTTLAIRWILSSARARGGKSFAEKLADELMDAAKNEGASIRKREETHKMAEANRAFSHYRL
ncbi:30S ribosomal protein S7 [bacterium]|nr:30S ribosomal protein S7 [bacterium]OIO85083.1 MAG: 30S ribosomal protein S7 [Anaerolineae bacterium CG2_30_58_95]PIU90744.1 MAG: 30S ribosomal protein S7 [Anaerolineae bacterium CG06_land_8_20_14_3_00_57_67]PIW20946.1 MAG: 30S ribosomal protein S7 [Anaerolineae bacterium CG17_big_fil_post_rev_8_21_14_2_50_57_27]PIX47915.1 MAG: 30S ribosomal protein S7 [Anaerolineae bacterium CG_4_8_14_3_um_filter_59_70]PJH74987.1 MAG: 30S ribosomal protein S7 [Anaerolineae bacterium CG_4_9_14_0_8_um_filter